ncbi:hypothetical protein EGM87_24385 (plasmid) [Sphingobium sp. RSMS]|uniref:hypothetical protein n=1 Tax=Sphingobium sp. RSMS TaxID=520734 RepID=UPI0010F88274|nr:hypothetical protein [Sphingobium sp. RSMS]UXC93915.1 hypothetical protein EGM87_24385 [Sphingobium sp. RSMS]
MVLAAALGLAGCGPEANPASVRQLPGQPSISERPSPPPAPGSNFSYGNTIALPGSPDTSGLEDAQIDAMFDAAVAQAQPMEEKRAICVGMQGLNDKAVKDAPARVVERLGQMLRLPAVPASQCRFDAFPFVVATRANAILYTVKVESRDALGIQTFWATATYGNLGSNGAKFRLVQDNGRWKPEATGVSVVS